MTYNKKDLKFGDRVKIDKTNSLVLDGVVGTVTGIASINWFDVYIVSLDAVFETDAKIMPKFSTVTIPEFNLTRV